MTQPPWIPLQLRDVGAQDAAPLTVLLAALAQVTASGPAGHELVSAAQQDVLWDIEARTRPEKQARLRAAALTVCDLARQGWCFHDEEDRVVISPPRKSSDPMGEKERVRSQLHIERDKQLETSAVLEFVRRMEQRTLFEGRFASVLDLMRDGRELRASIEAAGPEGLGEVIQPYLQFFEGEERCEHTGLRLREIWRYFRHTWATPYKSTPGRSMMILVRDRAARFHPVIGIAALASAPSQSGARDRWIGWTSEQVIAELREEPTDAWARWLRAELERAMGEIYVQDLFEDGVLMPSDLQAPRDEIFPRLEEEASQQRDAHIRFVEASRHKRPPEVEEEDEDDLLLLMLERDRIEWRAGDDPSGCDEDEDEEDSDALLANPLKSASWETRARTHLFRSKRAVQLQKLLRALRALGAHMGDAPTAAGLTSLLGTAEGVRSVRDIVRRAKADRMGVNLAEISICGSVAPYNALLGGKLVSMLVTSPEVLAAYRERYSSYQSLIASSRAGRPIRRGAALSLLMTTSLYGSGSSQYNRVRIPAERVGGAAGVEVRYRRLGMTRGFGTSHISDDTVSAMVRLIQQEDGGRRVNSIFGEGTNPRLRKVREGLSRLGFPDDALLNHGSPRVIYGISLVRNLQEHLLGLSDEPDYFFAQDDPSERTRQIVAWWRERWLGKRVERADVLDRLEAHRKTYPPRHGACVPIPRGEDSEPSPQLALFGG